MSEVFGLIYLQEQAPAGSGLITFLPIIIVFGIFYFLVIRPQNRERQRIERETKEMLDALKSGDKVVTTSGILGMIVAVREDTVQLKVADGVKIDILRSAVARKQTESGQAEAKS